MVGDDGWSSSLLRLADLTDGRPVRIELDGSAVLLVRNGDELFATGNRRRPNPFPRSRPA
jgi:nitrite reductase/ring-hydroxylating ferredoxin subunit